jgi:integrase
MQPKFRVVSYRGWYYAEWREAGVKRRCSLRTKDREAAEGTLKGFAGAYDVANRPEIISVAYVWNGYRETLRGRPAFVTMGYESGAVLQFFGGMGAGEITEQDCTDYRDARRSLGRKDWTIWTELGHLRSALKWAERKSLITKAPAIYRPPMPPPRDLRLTREEADLLVSSCSMPHVRLFVVLAMTTGARAGALFGLTWNRVDFKRKTIDLHDPGRPRTHKGRPTVPMNQTAATALQEARAAALTPYVIEWGGKPVKEIKHALANAARRCGLPWVTAHVFRHSAASWMAEDRIPMIEIAQFLGHADIRTTEKIYARLSPDYLRAAAKALELGHVLGVIEGGRAQRTKNETTP